MTLLAEAIAIVNKTGKRVHEAELYRLKGERTLQKFQVSSSKFPPTPKRRRKPKHASLKPLTLLASSKSNHWSCEVMSVVRLWQQAAQHASRNTCQRTRTTKHAPNSPPPAPCSPMCTTGSPQALTRKT